MAAANAAKGDLVAVIEEEKDGVFEAESNAVKNALDYLETLYEAFIAQEKASGHM